jgi:Cell division protein 48 (CDC48), N-terminal domain.
LTAGWACAGDALVAASYAAAAYQDLRSREVEDLTWAPAALGVALMVALGPRGALVPLALRIAAMAALGIAAWRLGLAASGDVAAMALIGANGCALSPVPELAAAMAAALAIWAAEAGLRRGTVLGVEEAATDRRWLPRRILGPDGSVLEDLSGAPPEEALAALGRYRGRPGVLVEASYGVPLAAALGAGYIAAVASLAALGACCRTVLGKCIISCAARPWIVGSGMVDSVTLRVMEAYTRDVGRGVARVDYEVMDTLGASTGDVLEIKGRKRTVAKCLPLTPPTRGGAS